MANVRFMCQNSINADDTTITASSENPDYPKENLLKQNPNDKWKATSSSANLQLYNGGNAIGVNALIILNHNLTGTITLEGDNSASPVTPAYSQNISVSDDIIIYFLSSYTAYDYWDIKNLSGAGGANVEIGHIYLGQTIDLDRNCTPFEPIKRDPTDFHIDRYGSIPSIEEMDQYVELPLFFGSINSGDKNHFETIRDAVGRKKWFYVCTNPGEASLHTVTYYVRMMKDWEIKPKGNAENVWTLEMPLEEIR